MIDTFIGNVWIYSIYDDFDSHYNHANDYCNPRLYTISFWTVSIMNIILVLFLIVCVVLFIVVSVTSKKAPTDESHGPPKGDDGAQLLQVPVATRLY